MSYPVALLCLVQKRETGTSRNLSQISLSLTISTALRWTSCWRDRKRPQRKETWAGYLWCWMTWHSIRRS
ncbi:hypothetical protein FR483_n592L [Paramecium bursaria Chlorella virus FR483]|uniref:Uncharacterized protein n592L n=1 Tax=Paramecium bursaria Chlorella virus FR483 TaxID=399781 RepID=A7J7U6_PBCVF|nr:hypothetical protein FR483_n592L [Paramecium bursaria Chlorella virus FR483]ABT15877.1 hypothetical protein FR483_n592L [Paramecium bursaria Chlorella virus FR483]